MISTPLNVRGREDKPLFTREVVQTAEHQSIGLIATCELSEAYRRFLQQTLSGSEILDKKTHTGGIIVLVE